MEIKKIVAIIRTSALEAVEEKLKIIGVKGISVSPVKGYGEYANFFRPDWMVSNAMLNIFTAANQVDAIVSTIMETACAGCPGDGIVAVMPVDNLYRIRTKSLISAEEI